MFDNPCADLEETMRKASKAWQEAVKGATPPARNLTLEEIKTPLPFTWNFPDEAKEEVERTREAYYQAIQDWMDCKDKNK